MVRVTVSPALALVVSELLEAILTVVRVGATVSNEIEVVSVVAVTVVPALPAVSEKSMESPMLVLLRSATKCCEIVHRLLSRMATKTQLPDYGNEETDDVTTTHFDWC